MGSPDTTRRRRLFDVGASRSRGRRSFLYGRNALNLRPHFRVRHPWITVLGAVAIIGIVFVGVRQFSTRAEVNDFYPTTCLGDWQNPSNAANQPETMGVPGVPFTSQNSAVFTASGTQIFCGGFVPPGFSSSGTITNVGLTLVWQVGNGTVAPPPGSSASPATSTIDAGPSTSAGSSAVTNASSSSDRTPVPASSSSTASSSTASLPSSSSTAAHAAGAPSPKDAAPAASSTSTTSSTTTESPAPASLSTSSNPSTSSAAVVSSAPAASSSAPSPSPRPPPQRGEEGVKRPLPPVPLPDWGGGESYFNLLKGGGDFIYIINN